MRAGAGSLIGLHAVVINQPYSLTATASVDAEIRQLTSENFHSLVNSRPELYFDVLRIIATEIRFVCKALDEFLSPQPLPPSSK